MPKDRIHPKGLAGLKYSLKRFLGTQFGNILKAAALRRKYGLDKKNYFSGPGDAFYEVAVVAIFKGEEEYLQEWIEFHRVVGVEHFFLYDNGDSLAARELLSSYIEDGVVTYIPFPEFPDKAMRSKYGKNQFRKLSMQNLAYGDFVRLYAPHCRWAVKIDLDEFIYPVPPFNTLSEAFDRFDKPGVKGFSVRAYRFGPSGVEHRSGKPVIETYSMRYPEPDKNWKVVGRSRLLSTLSRYHGAHNWFYKLTSFARHLYDDQTCAAVRINHYYVKSREEYLDKIERHSVGHKAGKETADKWPLGDAQANFQDEGDILHFLPALKERLG